MKITETLEFEENGGLSVVGIQWQNGKEDLEITVEVDAGSIEQWSLLCRGELAHNTSLGWVDQIDIVSEHVLLWPQTEPLGKLWFSGRGQNASSVIGDLWSEHRKLVGRWFPFTHFLNGSDLMSLIEGGYGMLAEGPEPLIAAYRQVLHKQGFKASVTSRPALHPKEKWSTESDELVALLLGNWHVVASSVEVRRIE